MRGAHFSIEPTNFPSPRGRPWPRRWWRAAHVDAASTRGWRAYRALVAARFCQCAGQLSARGVAAAIAADVYCCAACRGRSFCWRRCPPARQVVPSRAWRARRTGASSAWLPNSTTGRAALNERAVARPGARSRVRCLELNLLSGLGHPHKCSSPGSDRLEVRQSTNAAKYGRVSSSYRRFVVFCDAVLLLLPSVLRDASKLFDA